jgi:hypothetical protein
MSSQVSADCLLLPQIINQLYGYSLSTPMTCCDNTSIICVNGNIRRIVLESYNLMGSLPGSETITHTYIYIYISLDSFSLDTHTIIRREKSFADLTLFERETDSSLVDFREFDELEYLNLSNNSIGQRIKRFALSCSWTLLTCFDTPQQQQQRSLTTNKYACIT